MWGVRGVCVVCGVCVCRCESAGRDDYGSKWSMSALLRHLHSEGRDVAGETIIYILPLDLNNKCIDPLFSVLNS